MPDYIGTYINWILINITNPLLYKNINLISQNLILINKLISFLQFVIKGFIFGIIIYALTNKKYKKIALISILLFFSLLFITDIFGILKIFPIPSILKGDITSVEIKDNNLAIASIREIIIVLLIYITAFNLNKKLRKESIRYMRHFIFLLIEAALIIFLGIIILEWKPQAEDISQISILLGRLSIILGGAITYFGIKKLESYIENNLDNWLLKIKKFTTYIKS